MNPEDYLFFQENPSFLSLDDDVEPTSLLPPSLTFNDLKEFDTSYLDDPSNYPLIQSAFIDKINDRHYNIVKNAVTGEYIFPMTPYRGNESYARKTHKRIQPVIDAYANKEFSKPIKGSRETQFRKVNGIFVTLTFAHQDSKAMTTSLGFPVKHWKPSDAWLSLKGSNSIINQFKMELSRIVGSYGCCCVKEGGKGMYPAPHLMIVFDNPLIAHRYGKQWVLGDSLHNRELVDKIQSIWERIAGSHCKINAIVSAKDFAYQFKYIQKSINSDVQNINELKESELVCLNTHLNNALYGLNNTISPAFLKKLDYTKELTLLDITRNKLKQVKKKLIGLSDEIENKGGFNYLIRSSYRDLFNEYYSHLAEIERLRAEIYDIKMETSPWFFVRGGFGSLESANSYTDIQ